MWNDPFLQRSAAQTIAPPDLGQMVQRPLRVALNYGNVVLAYKDAETGEPGGVTAALARKFANDLGISLEFVEFGAARDVADAVAAGSVDLAFVAIDPDRATEMDFTMPYAVMEGVYLVPEKSSLRQASQVGEEGVPVVVARGTAYDKHLSRTLPERQLVRVDTSAEVIPHCRADGDMVAAGARQQLEGKQADWPGSRFLHEPFMEIRQALCVPKGRPGALGIADTFIREALRSGLVVASLQRDGFASVKVPHPVSPARDAAPAMATLS